MMPADRSDGLTVARELYSLAKAGLAYCTNEYDLERYHRLEEIAAGILAEGTGLAIGSILESFSAQVGYATPKIDVRGAVIRQGRILLVQESADGHWTMPGGWADVGEAPAAMVVREVLEESGYQVRVDRLVAVLDANRIAGRLNFYHSYKLIFLCTITGGEPRPSLETLAVDFFDPGQLPELSSYRTNERMLAEVFAHVADPSRPAAFD